MTIVVSAVEKRDIDISAENSVVDLILDYETAQLRMELSRRTLRS